MLQVSKHDDRSTNLEKQVMQTTNPNNPDLMILGYKAYLYLYTV